MNERIKELAEQASLALFDDTASYRRMPGLVEKLTELIIAECVAKVSEWDMGINDPVGATDTTSQVARDMVAEIKKHFGIK